MQQIIFITGGTRSGKSSFAMKLARQLSDKPVYIATARIWDEDFRMRIQKHRDERGAEWETIEEDIHIDTLKLSGNIVVVDCITLWLTNIFHDSGYMFEKSLNTAKIILERFFKNNCTIIVISNELGMGIHGSNEVSRKFADLQGFINQYIANLSDDVYLMISGIPVKVK